MNEGFCPSELGNEGKMNEMLRANFRVIFLAGIIHLFDES